MARYLKNQTDNWELKPEALKTFYSKYIYYGYVSVTYRCICSKMDIGH